MAPTLHKLILAIALLLATITSADSDADGDDEMNKSNWKFSWVNDVIVEQTCGNLAFAFSKEYIEKRQSFFMK